MKQFLHLKTMLVTLLTMLVAMNASAQTQTYFSCNFDNYTNTSFLTSNGWTMDGSVYMNANSPYCYSGKAVQLGNDGAGGTVTTPILNNSLPSDVKLSFYTGTGKKDGVTLTITIEGNGAFLNSDNTTSESVTISVTKSDGKFYTYNLTGCTKETKIKFSTNRIAGLDNVVVTGDADPRTPVTLTYSADKYRTATESGEITGAPTLTVEPVAAASEVFFSSSNENVAKFENGKLIAVAPGTTTITASISGSETYRDAKDEYTLTVGLTPSNFNFDPSSYTVTYGDNFTKPKLNTVGGYNGTITYTSSNEKVAKVDPSSGEVTILAVGVTTITASGTATSNHKADDASYTLTVNDIQGSATGGSGASVFKETFNDVNGTGGNDGEWSGNIATNDLNPSGDNKNVDQDDWTFTKGNGANQCAKFGTGKVAGSATTREIEVTAGLYTLTFKAAPWANESSTIMDVTVTGGSIEGISTGNMTTGKWNDFSATITPTPNSSIIQITFSASNNRFFLDEINVAAPSTGETVPVTIPSSGWGTFCYKYPLDFTAASSPEGLKAYAVSSTSSSNATLTQITEKIIGGTGIIINGTPGATYAIKVADNGTAYSGINLLTGTLAPTYIEEGQYFLKSGRFVYSSAGILSANKAYLKKENAPEAAANFGFVTEDATGISEVLNNISLDDDKWYDLSGRAVSPTSKGIYIHNGKKYVIK